MMLYRSVDFNDLVPLFVRPFDGGFQADLIASHGGLHERLMHEQPRHDVVFAYLIFYFSHEPGRLKRGLLLRPFV